MKNKLQNYIDSIATVGISDIGGDEGLVYYSKEDKSYLTRVGLEDGLEFLMELGITEQIQSRENGGNVSCIGFNPLEQKWYGWSHRAVFGFGVGSEVEKGDCSFLASNKEEFKEACLSFWGGGDFSIGDDKAEFIGNSVEVTYTYNNIVLNKMLRGTTYRNVSPFPETWGKGEWVALTLEDAREMAQDFAQGVS